MPNTFTSLMLVLIALVIFIAIACLLKWRAKIKNPAVTRVSDQEIQRLNVYGKVLEEIRWDEIEVIFLRTLDGYIYADDYYYYFENPQLGKFVVVGESDPEWSRLRARISAWENFDREAVENAYRCKDDACFEIWRK